MGERHPSAPVSWQEFARSDPDLAATGRRLLFQYNVGLAYFATVSASGAPRLHPLSPVLSAGRLYIFVLAGSPKKADLLNNPRFALQTFPPANIDFLQAGEEFYITGIARPVTDLELRLLVVHDAIQHIGEEELLFELKIQSIMHTTWKLDAGELLTPARRKWRPG